MKQWNRSAFATVAVALVASVLSLVASPAGADTAPPPNDPTRPKTVGVNPLPTVQIGQGVVWSMAIIGNTVYAGGEFSTARPAGAAPGTQEVTRNNLLAFDIRTGVLLNAWAPSANGPVYDVTASPDGTRVYASGNFTTVSGITRQRIVALNPTTGAVINSFAPTVNGAVHGVIATNSTVYFGGSFSLVSGQTRGRLAALNASNGAVLSWAPNAAGGIVRDLAISPDGSEVVVGGAFTSLNGSTNPGYGLAALDSVTGALLPWEANNVLVRNGGPDSEILSVTPSADAVYVTGGTYNRNSGNLEGTAKLSWQVRKVLWLEDCHGDHYDAMPMDGVVYTASHAHYCGNVPGGFNQPQPWVKHKGVAFTEQTTGTLKTEYLGYYNYAGTPAPSMVHWFPNYVSGTYTQAAQADWNLVGNGDYLVAGGEFPRVGNVNQQGLVRFARPEVPGNPNSSGGEIGGSFTNPTVTSPGPGQALVCWQSNFDRDNEFMDYQLIRNNDQNNPIATRTSSSAEWDRPYLCYLDTGLTPGSSVTYRIFASDAFGNTDHSNEVPVTVSGTGDFGTYAQTVAEDGPMHYWRLDEASGSTGADTTGLDNLTLAGGVTRNASGAITGHAAATFSGSSSQTAYNQTSRPGLLHQFSVEAWFRTSTLNGGKIIGFGSSQSGASGTHDRMLYLDNSGRVNFGSRMNSSLRVLTSASSMNNNQWHHAVGTVGPYGMSLYVDGQRVGFRSDTTTGHSYDGWWRVGGDNLSSSWANAPTNDYFSGSIDEVAVYATALSGNQVRDHYLASGRTLSGPAKPTDTYGAAVYDDEPDAFWRLAETSGTTAGDSSGNGSTAGYLDNVFLGAGPTKGGVSGIGLATDRSASFDGSGDYVALTNSVPSPARFSTELWFRTNTTSGGKLIGFGNNRTSNSSTDNFDRHVFMTNAGKLRFGVRYAGMQQVLESPASYNNNQWHHMVATFGPLGMRLYVDGGLVAENNQTGAQSYTGYWRVGGDNLSGWASRPTSDYFAGSIDEVAVYSRQISTAEVVDHFAKAGGTPANQPPVAAFSSAANDLAVVFDSTGSQDPDGTVTAWSWSFGDGATSTQANPSHTYASSGNYTVELTVTDNDGDSDSVSHSVAVTANQAPTAAFTSSVSDLTANFDSSGSSDSDGTIASRSWAFGDGGTSTLSNPSHAYAVGGTYQVTLTVTDNDGATGSVTQPVTVNEPGGPQPLVSDTFTRTLTGGWGTSDLGGTWTHSTPLTRYSVSGGVGQMNLDTAGAGPWAYLTSVSATDVAGSVDLSVDKPATGGGIYHTVSVRRVGTSEYRVKLWLPSDGTVRVVTSRVVSGTQTTLGSATVPGLTYTPGDMIRLEFSVTGSGTTTLTAKAWKVGTAEPPTVQLTSTDTTAGLQGPGSVALQAYMGGTATNAPVLASFDNLVVFPG